MRWQAGEEWTLADELVRRGMGVISPEQGLDAMERLIARGTPRGIVLPMDWPQYLRQYGERIPRRVSQITALPVLTGQKQRARREAPAPASSDVERTLIRIVEEVLEIEAVGTRTNLFDLGADSLLVAQIHGKLQESLGREIPLVDVFRHPTIAELAEYLKAGHNGEGSNEPSVAPAGTPGRQVALNDARDRGRQQREALAARAQREREARRTGRPAKE